MKFNLLYHTINGTFFQHKFKDFNQKNTKKYLTRTGIGIMVLR